MDYKGAFLLPFFVSSWKWHKIVENGEEWRFALADRGLDSSSHFARLRARYRHTNI